MIHTNVSLMQNILKCTQIYTNLKNWSKSGITMKAFAMKWAERVQKQTLPGQLVKPEIVVAVDLTLALYKCQVMSHRHNIHCDTRCRCSLAPVLRCQLMTYSIVMYSGTHYIYLMLLHCSCFISTLTIMF